MTLTQDQIQRLIPRVDKMKRARKPYIRRCWAGGVVRSVRVMILRRLDGSSARVERTTLIHL